MKSLTSVEIFAGCGGSLLGTKRANFSTQICIENDKFAHSTLLKNRLQFLKLPAKKLILSDIRDYSFSPLKTPDLVCGGPPCQPFSTGGQHLGPKDGRNMFPEAIRCIRELRPRAFIFENVKGLVRQKFENYLEYLVLQLKYPELVQWQNESLSDHHKRLEDQQTSGSTDGLRYNIVSRVLNAADFGVPQNRERLFIVGFRADEQHAWHFPEPTHSLDALAFSQNETGEYWKRHDIISHGNTKIFCKKRYNEEKLARKPWRTVRDAFIGIPDPFPNELSAEAEEFPDHVFRDGAKSYPGHTGCRFDEPAKTLKAGYNGVPGGENMIRLEDNTVRYFTIREMAILQTFPDKYQFEGAWSAKIKQIGNAVPVDLFRILAESVRQSLLV